MTCAGFSEELAATPGEQQVSLNRWSISTNLHAVTFSKAAIFFVMALRTSDLT